MKGKKFGFVFSMVVVVAVAASVFGSVGKVSATCGNVGVCWSQVTAPTYGNGDNVLTAVHVVNSNTVWAVGYFVDALGRNKELIEKGVKTVVGGYPVWTWTVQTSPNPNVNNTLSGVSIARNDLSATDVWAVGSQSDGFSPTRTLIERYNGTSWSAVTSPNVGSGINILSAVAGSKANNYWAVGYYSDNGQLKTLTLAYTSTVLGWQVVASPNLGAGGGGYPNNYLNSVTVVDSTHVYASGYYVDSNGITYPLLLTWNGTSWSASNPTGASGAPFYGISFNAVDSGFAVGGFNTAVAYQDIPLIGWRLNSPSTNATGSLHGAAWVSTNQLWAVGTRGVSGTNISQTQYWDGSTWTYYQAEDPSGSTDISLLGVDGVANTDTWAVGYYVVNGRKLPLIEHYN